MKRMIATLGYEFRTQLRRPALWIVYGVALAVVAVPPPGSPLFSLDLGPLDPADPRVAMLHLGRISTTVLTFAFGLMVADRLVRDDELRVGEVLDSTPASHGVRLIGKYAGVCLATAVPYVLIFFGRALVYVAAGGDTGALGWSVTVFAGMVLPGLLYVGALGMVVPLLTGPLLFRVLFVVYWFFNIFPGAGPIPSLSRTYLDAMGGHAEYGLLSGDLYDGVLRHGFTPAQGWLWVATMVALAGALLGLARLRTARKAA